MIQLVTMILLILNLTSMKSSSFHIHEEPKTSNSALFYQRNIKIICFLSVLVKFTCHSSIFFEHSHNSEALLNFNPNHEIANPISISGVLFKTLTEKSHKENLYMFLWIYLFDNIFTKLILSIFLLYISEKKKTINSIIVLLLFSFFFLPCLPYKSFKYTSGTTGDNRSYGMCESDQGGYYYVGFLYNSIRGKNEGVILKFTQEGNEIWSYLHFCGVGNVWLQGIDKTVDGGCIAAGDASAACAGISVDYAIVIVRLYSNGGLNWAKHIKEFENNNAMGVRALATGDFAIVGSTVAPHPYIIYANSNGEHSWHNIIMTENVEFFRVEESISGNLIAVGDEDHPCVFSKYSPYGSLLLTKNAITLNGAYACCSGIKRTPDNNYFFLVGTVWKDGINGNDGYIAKINDDDTNTILWAKAFGSTSHEKARAISISYNGKIFGTGIKTRTGGTNWMFWIFLLTSEGDLLRSEEYGDFSTDSLPFGIVLHDSGNFAAGGFTIISGMIYFAIAIDNFGCFPGSFFYSTTNLCKHCQPGSVQPLAEQTTCAECNVGHYQDNEGKTACIECPPNKYQPDSGKASCLPCNPGFYQLQSGQTFCKKCHVLCKHCEGPKNIQCSECWEDILNLEALHHKTCNCQKGYTLDISASDRSNYCAECEHYCQECTSKNYCVLCKTNSPGLVLHNGVCECTAENAIELFDMISEKTICTWCHPLCSSCYGVKNTECHTCNATRNAVMIAKDTCDCDRGYYYNDLKKSCETCNELCISCEGPSFSECTKCNTKLAKYVEDQPSMCLSICPDGYYKDLTICRSIFVKLGFIKNRM